MSTLDEKLEKPSPVTPGGSRQTLAQLVNRWGAAPVRPDGTIHVHSMQHEVWRPIGTTKGAGAVYQLDREPT